MTQVVPLATTPAQMSLALFEEMFSQGAAIADSKQEVGFLRNNLFIDVADLGLAARRVIDAAFLIVAQAPQVQERYDIDLNYFRWLTSYDSNNFKHLRSVLREAQKASVQVTEAATSLNTNNERWISVPMLGAVGLSNGRVAFEVHASLQRQIKAPTNSHFLSLRITASFTLLFARVLYEHALLAVDRQVTEWIPVAEVKGWTGRASALTLEFKYFRRSTLDPAVQQLNELSGLQVSYDRKTLPGSKTVGFLRFSVTRKAGGSLLEQSTLYTVLKDEFGLSAKNFDELLANRTGWADERIKQAIEFTRVKIAEGKVSRSVSGFLMMAIRENWKISTSDRIIAAQQEKAANDKGAHARRVAESDDAHQTKKKATTASVAATAITECRHGLERYATLGITEQQNCLIDFLRTPQAALIAGRAKINVANLTISSVLEQPLVAQVFGQFIMKVSSG